MVCIQIGETALHHAAWEGELETVKLLLEAGADPNIRERVSYTCRFAFVKLMVPLIFISLEKFHL